MAGVESDQGDGCSSFGSVPAFLLPPACQAVVQSSPELEILGRKKMMTTIDGVDSDDAHLGHVDDDVTGRVDHQHEVVQHGEVISPARPVIDLCILEHLTMIL